MTLVLAFVQPAQETDRVKLGVMNRSGAMGVSIDQERGYFQDVGAALETSRFASAIQMMAPRCTSAHDFGGRADPAGRRHAADRARRDRGERDRSDLHGQVPAGNIPACADTRRHHRSGGAEANEMNSIIPA